LSCSLYPVQYYPVYFILFNIKLFNIILFNIKLFSIILFNIKLFNIILFNIKLFNIKLFNINLYNIILFNINLFNIILFNIILFNINLVMFNIIQFMFNIILFNNFPVHPELTRERSIRFLLFEIKCVFVYISTIFKLTDLFILYFFIKNVYANKKIFERKGYKIM